MMIKTNVINDSFEFENMKDKDLLLAWVREWVTPGPGRCPSSYTLKHSAEHALGFYVSNGQMKGALAAAGIPVEDETCMNWIPIGYRYGRSVKEGSFLHWLSKNRKNKSFADFAADALADMEFPLAGGLAQFRDHLRRKRACREALRALDGAFRQYEKSGEMVDFER